MYSALSNKITNFLVANNAVKEEEREVYNYGLELLISSIVNFAVILLIGYLLERLLQTVLFLITFCPLRQFSGGVHASSHLKCAVYFNVTYVACIFIEKSFLINTNKVILIFALVVASLIIAFLSPVEDRNKPLNCNELKLFKKQTYKMLFLWNAIILASSLLLKIDMIYFIYSVIAIVLLSALIIIGYIKNMKEGYFT